MSNQAAKIHPYTIFQSLNGDIYVTGLTFLKPNKGFENAIDQIEKPTQFPYAFTLYKFLSCEILKI